MEAIAKKWKIDLYGNVTDLRGKIVHTPKWYKSDLSHRKQVIANAKLIASAPEMLKCANDFMLAYDSLGKELQAKLYKEYGIEPFGLNSAIKQATK